jgi:hypothetical protein
MNLTRRPSLTLQPGVLGQRLQVGLFDMQLGKMMMMMMMMQVAGSVPVYMSSKPHH